MRVPSPPRAITPHSQRCASAEWYDPRTPAGQQYFPNKTDPIFSGLKTSIVYSPLGDRGLFDSGGYGALLSATDAARGIEFIRSLKLPPDAEAAEVLKYQNAVDFRVASGKTGLALDLAYDGIILQRGMEANAVLLNYTQADFVIMDYESFGARETWIQTVHLSANAEAKRLQGESNVSLAVRLGRQFLENHTRSLLQYAPAGVKLGVYDLIATGRNIRCNECGVSVPFRVTSIEPRVSSEVIRRSRNAAVQLERLRVGVPVLEPAQRVHQPADDPVSERAL